MRKEQVITFHRVKVDPNLNEDHVAYDYRGREGVIQPSRGPSWTDVAVHLDGEDPNTTHYFKPEWLMSTEPPPAKGDVVDVRGVVSVYGGGNSIYIKFDDREGAVPVPVPIDQVVTVVQRAPKLPPEPEHDSVIQIYHATSNAIVGVWWRRLGRRPERTGGAWWLNMKNPTEPHKTWREVVERAIKNGDTIRVYHPTGTIHLKEVN